MKRVIIALAAALFTAHPLLAQDTLYVYTDTIYVNKAAEPVDKDKAVERAIVTRIGNNTKVKYYTLDGTPTRVENYSIYTELHQVRNGALLQFYPNGKIRRREVYKRGDFVSGELLAEDGSALPFSTPYFEAPEYPNGVMDFAKKCANSLSSKTFMNMLNKGKKVQGTVLIQFTVNTEGKIEDIKVIKSLHPKLDEDAVKALQKAAEDETLIPAKIEGTPVNYKMVTPISFKLKK